jgi:hypothetical protein
MKNINYPKAIFAAVLAVYGIILVSSPSEYRFLDRVDLVIHEAGHMLFRWFGEFLMVIGGTLGQLGVPAGIAVYFYLRSERFSSAVSLFWFGQNFFNISNYIKDAQAMEMPLVSIGGGEDTIHDWNYLLLKFNVLRHDHAIGSSFVVIGALIIVISVVAAFYFSVDREETE